MSNSYKLRITSLDCLSVCKGLDSYSYCVESEGSNRPHMHFFIKTELTDPAIRRRVKKLPDYFKGTKGNSFYSLGKCVAEGDSSEFPYLKYQAYMAKHSKVTYVGFDPEYLKRLRVAIELRKEKVETEKASIRKSRMTILQQIELDLNYAECPPVDIHALGEAVVDWYRDSGKLVRKFYIVSVVQTLALKYLPDYRHLLMQSVMQAVFPILPR